jgi:DNA mismatch repair protein MutL
VCVPIRILPDSVAAAIAAGEVVERPASVVKELVENAIDARAGRIEVRIEQGGRGLIEVADDGVGIPAAEVPLALARYATSKLETADDLMAIKSLGFRGEALASIGAVTRLELVTRAVDEDTGTRLVVDGGAVGKPQPTGSPQGTVVRVRDLFFNVPARRRFLKSEATERRRISDLVTRYALAYSRIQFNLVQEGRPSFHSSGAGDRTEVLAAVFGVEGARMMIPLSSGDDTPIQVEGFIGEPSISRANRRELTFFVNGRWVQDARLTAAVGQAYSGLLMVGRHPVAVLLLTLPPESVDVNVHPAKAEVRFREPDRVFAVVQRVVRSTLLGQASPPAFDLGARWGGPSASELRGMIQPDWRVVGWGEPEEPQPAGTTVQPGLPTGEVPLLRAVGQVGASYLVAEGPDGVYLVDQHAAHERILFEQLMDSHAKGDLESQILLEPVTVEMSAKDSDLLGEQLETLRGLGFDIEHFGGNSYRVRSVPSLLSALAPAQALEAVVAEFEEDETPLLKETEARLAARVCKRASVKAGQVLSLPEQERLLRDLEACRSPRTCPHGRPTMIHLSVEALERQFGRRG